MSDITLLLNRVHQGDPKAASELLPLVYGELRRLAAHRLAGENRQHTLQPTALVHEAWLKIAGDDKREWNGRQHFFAAAAEAMRRILVDRARRRRLTQQPNVKFASQLRALHRLAVSFICLATAAVAAEPDGKPDQARINHSPAAHAPHP